MAFHKNYSNLLTQLPPSLIKARWNRLTTQKKNPLSEGEASSISLIVEAFLKHEVDRYQKTKKCQYNPTKSHTTVCTAIPFQNDIQIISKTSSANSEEEINARVKEATDILR